ncbi:hypothetical protein KJD95_16585 [Escherichia marmotae]|uniref:hypothetical protein n=1 Tax=Escherichia TaxID=561 RepID=UPI00165014E8|nr:hypothetical protein [Escherichia marmotae]HAX7610282.1 hypothetical protein [Escherichia coli]MDQ9285852.1 hypothetical protein [Escherichia marmotae]HBD5340659.1 hypothetical protein [Escherichia coli]HCJ8171826.1 hypothetical protein [Escherichia coli]HDD8700727.1 hypothetical protein [Escherichia coli]
MSSNNLPREFSDYLCMDVNYDTVNEIIERLMMECKTPADGLHIIAVVANFLMKHYGIDVFESRLAEGNGIFLKLISVSDGSDIH